MFSSRTSWHRQQNKLSQALESRRKSGLPLHDLTISIPTLSGISYPEQDILRALSKPSVLHYEPEPRGLLTAREAVSQYYRKKQIEVNPSSIFLTASSSESYSLIFKLLCNTQDTVIVPAPSYPLFDYLAQINDVRLERYILSYDGKWHIDIDSLERVISSTTRAIVLVNPHNPSGMFLKREEYEHIKEIARAKRLALIVDEVFIDYAFELNNNTVSTTASEQDVFTFTLNGISKSLGLPQMKLGWIVVAGQPDIVNEADHRLDILCDTFLSVNTPVQKALPDLMTIGEAVRSQILERVKSNYANLQSAVTSGSGCSVLNTEGGWYAIVRVPRTKSDEEWALHLLEHCGVYVYPGYFFELEEGHLVMSLLVPNILFQKAVIELMNSFSAV